MTTKLYLEDLHVGDRFTSAGHALDEAQILAFAKQFDPQPFHLDHAAAEASLFKGLAASGWHTAALVMRLLVDSVPLANGLIGAQVTSLEWASPTRPTDVLTVTSEVLEIKPSRSRPDRGMVTVRVEARNQHDELRERQVCVLVVNRRPA